MIHPKKSPSKVLGVLNPFPKNKYKRNSLNQMKTCLRVKAHGSEDPYSGWEGRITRVLILHRNLHQRNKVDFIHPKKFHLPSSRVNRSTIVLLDMLNRLGVPKLLL